MSRPTDWCAYDDVHLAELHDADPEPLERPAPIEYADDPDAPWAPEPEPAPVWLEDVDG